MHDLALVDRVHWTWRFTIMLTLALIVAVMGLLADSAAVVIGAMLLAPLMTPVLGTAAALAMGLPRKVVVAIIRVVVATAWCVLLGYIVGRLNLTSTGEFTDEITARVQPTLLDLVVALGAGTAGAYATVRTDTSGALPGVAVAVALVPPLGVVGLTLAAGNMTYAKGAMLLYTTNLTAVVFAGIVVFVTTGFVPPRRLITSVPRILGGMVTALVLVSAITVLLVRSSQGVAADADRERAIRDGIDVWLAGSGLEVDGVSIDNDAVLVEISGAAEPPSREDLRQILNPIAGSGVQLAVFFDEQRESSANRASSDVERRDEQIRELLDEWLRANDEGNNYRLMNTEIDGEVLTVSVSGAGDPPPIDDLINRLSVLPESYRVVAQVRWNGLETERRTTADERRLDDLGLIATTWATRQGAEVTSVELLGDTLEVEVRGPSAVPIEPLLDELATADQPPADVKVYFTQRVELTTTATAPTTTTG